MMICTDEILIGEEYHHCTKNEIFYWGFLQQIWPNLQEIVDLVTFTEEILNEKLYFLCSARCWKNWFSFNDHPVLSCLGETIRVPFPYKNESNQIHFYRKNNNNKQINILPDLAMHDRILIDIYLFKVNNKSTRKSCEIRSK